MKSSGHVTPASPPAMPEPYPSGASGDWRTFTVGVCLIAIFLSALAFSPTGTEWVPGEPSMQNLAIRPTPTSEALGEALALQERYTQTVGSERVFAQTQEAEDL